MKASKPQNWAQRYKVELMQVLEDMQEWGGEHSFIEETRACCPRIHKYLEADNYHLLLLLDGQFTPANSFIIFDDALNLWAN
jgi:hypothetical protein